MLHIFIPVLLTWVKFEGNRSTGHTREKIRIFSPGIFLSVLVQTMGKSDREIEKAVSRVKKRHNNSYCIHCMVKHKPHGPKLFKYVTHGLLSFNLGLFQKLTLAFSC